MHPIDDRYHVSELAKFFGEESALRYILKVELAHLAALTKRGICPTDAYDKISERASAITADMWYEKQKEPKYKHNIRALMALVNDGLPVEVRRFFHLGLTSYDAVDNANVLALKDATYKVVLPDMISLGHTLLDLAENYRSTTQVGRSHGQHGEPTKFGREIAWHADRWGRAIVRVKDATDAMEGKLAGAMGTKASLALLGDANELERDVLESIKLRPARIATQVLQPEDASNYYSQLVIAFGVLNNLANDMRHLARTEIGEIALQLPEGHGKSSTMLHKGMSERGVVIGNPEDFENICGQYRAVMPHIISVYLNQECEHNRDIRNSAAERYFRPEILDSFVYSVRRCDATMRTVRANEEVMRSRVENALQLLMEPAYIALALDGESDAQQYVRDAVKTHGDFRTALERDERLKHAINALPSGCKTVFESPLNYVGESERQVDDVLSHWVKEFEGLAAYLEAVN